MSQPPIIAYYTLLDYIYMDKNARPSLFCLESVLFIEELLMK